MGQQVLFTVKRSEQVNHIAFLAPTGAQEEAMLSVRACVRASVRPFPQIMSSSSILKSPGGF